MTNNSKILIVDDESIGRQLLEAIFHTEGFDIIFAENGEIALQMAIENKPEAILLDVMMPDMDGFEVCRQIRKNETIGNTPILLITALDDRDSRLHGLDAGANDYISKPFDRIELLSKVKTIIQLNRKQKQDHSEINNNNIPEIRTGILNIVTNTIEPSPKFIDRIFPGNFVIKHSSSDYPAVLYSIYQRDNTRYIFTIGSEFTDQNTCKEMVVAAGCILLKVIRENNTSNPVKILEDYISISDNTALNNASDSCSLKLLLASFVKENNIINMAGINACCFNINNKGINEYYYTGKLKNDPDIISGNVAGKIAFMSTNLNIKDELELGMELFSEHKTEYLSMAGHQANSETSHNIINKSNNKLTDFRIIGLNF